MSDDAEFDAFLKGDDALSRRFQAMPQAGPSAALDAAILQRARDLMAQEARPAAANDAGIATPAPRVAGLGWRWRVPGAIAATVLAGVFAHQAYQASSDMERNTGMPAAEMPARPAAPPAADGAAAPSAPAAANAAPPALEPMPEERRAAPPVLADAPVRESLPLPPVRPLAKPAAPAAAAPAPSFAEQPAPAPIAAVGEAKQDIVAGYSAPPPPAPAAAARVAPAPEPMQRVEISGDRYQAREAESAMAIATQKGQDEYKSKKVEVTGSRIKSAAAQMPPDEWFGVIEDMLEQDKGAGKDKGKAVLAEWRKFRQMYPYYPVPQTFEEKIKALEK